MIAELLNTALSLEWAPADSQVLPEGPGVHHPLPPPNFALIYNEFSQECTSEQTGWLCQQHTPSPGFSPPTNYNVNKVPRKLSRFKDYYTYTF